MTPGGYGGVTSDPKSGARSCAVRNAYEAQVTVIKATTTASKVRMRRIPYHSVVAD